MNYLKAIDPEVNEENILEDEKVEKYAQAVSEWHDAGENDTIVDNYKDSVLKLLFSNKQ